MQSQEILDFGLKTFNIFRCNWFFISQDIFLILTIWQGYNLAKVHTASPWVFNRVINLFFKMKSMGGGRQTVQL